MVTIYIADDEKNIRELLGSFLRKEGLDVELFETGDQLLLRFLEKAADVVILDVMMPGTNGYDTASAIRKRSDVPIILLTARDSDQDFIDGFAAGADDYFTKPFSPIQLTLRVKAILQRQIRPSASLSEMQFGGLSLSEKTRDAHFQEKGISLTNTEYELLKVLMEHQEEAVAREDLLLRVWGYESDVETRVTDDTIKRLRKKLRQVDSDVQIETVWGFGFKLLKK
ncbi:response regulator transcription factor [Streptococcus cameli]